MTGRYQDKPDHNLHGEQSDHHAQVETDEGEDPRSQQSGYRGYRANGGRHRQYDTVPIMDQHEAYGIETVGDPQIKRVIGHILGRPRSPGFVNDRPYQAVARPHTLVLDALTTHGGR